MRRRRAELGLTVRDVALRAGLRESSASYISQLESGAKAPHESLARRLAELLGDDPRIYLAWAALGSRSHPVQTAQAVQVLAELLGHAAYELPSVARAPKLVVPEEPAPAREPQAGTRALPTGSSSATSEPQAAIEPLAAPRDLGGAGTRELPAIERGTGAAGVPSARALIPEFEEGADPGDAARAAPRTLALHRIAPETLAAVEPLVRPFAYRLSESGVRRVRDALRPGELAVLTRRTWPLEPAAPYAVRLSGHALLARVLWNERQLLLLPGPGDSDFIVLDAPGRTTLERLLAGRVAATLRAIP
jgi:transcriptional regulator with XRE-family HTH domain